jgi:hypothetical protein
MSLLSTNVSHLGLDLLSTRTGDERAMVNDAMRVAVFEILALEVRSGFF